MKVAAWMDQEQHSRRATALEPLMATGGADGDKPPLPSSFSCEGGPYNVLTYKLGRAGSSTISTSTVYYPQLSPPEPTNNNSSSDEPHTPGLTSVSSTTPTRQLDPPGSASLGSLPVVCIVPGWICAERCLGAWGPFLASHGIVAVTIGTMDPIRDMPYHRSVAVLDAVAAMKGENARSDSPLCGRLDEEAFGVMGYSLGGGGVVIAAAKEDTGLKCVVALTPSYGGKIVPDIRVCPEGNQGVPIMFLTGDKDEQAPPEEHGKLMYDSTPPPTPKLYFELSGGDHGAVDGPAGTHTVHHMVPCCTGEGRGGGKCCCLGGFLCCCLAAWAPSMQCCWGIGQPTATYDSPEARAQPPGGPGAIGGVVLAWLKLWLGRDERYWALLTSSVRRMHADKLSS